MLQVSVQFVNLGGGGEGSILIFVATLLEILQDLSIFVMEAMEGEYDLKRR